MEDELRIRLEDRLASLITFEARLKRGLPDSAFLGQITQIRDEIRFLQSIIAEF